MQRHSNRIYKDYGIYGWSLFCFAKKSNFLNQIFAFWCPWNMANSHLLYQRGWRTARAMGNTRSPLSSSGSLANPIFQFLHSSLKIVYLRKTIFVPWYTRHFFSVSFNIWTSFKGHLMCYLYGSSFLFIICISSRCIEDFPCLRSHTFTVVKKKKKILWKNMFPTCGTSYTISSDQDTHFIGQVI